MQDYGSKKDNVNTVSTSEEEETVLTIVEDNYEIWLADTGASCHVTNNDNCLYNYRKCENDSIIVGDRRKCEVTSIGDLQLIAKDMNESLILHNVRIAKDIGKNIISIGSLLKQGGTLNGNEDTLTVSLNNQQMTLHKNYQDGLYYKRLKRLKINHEMEYCNEITDDENENEWKVVAPRDKKKWPKMSRKEAHSKWGHPHLDQLNKMALFNRVNVYGKLPKCAGCGLIKSRAMKTTKRC